MAQVIEDGENAFAVVGLSQDQATDLLFHIDEVPVGEENESIGRRQLGDFGVGVLIFLGTASTIAGILRWVGRQRDDIRLKLKFLNFEIEVDKKTSVTEVKRIAGEHGTDLN